MGKKYKIILSVILVVLIATGVLLATGGIDINKMITEKEIRENPGLTSNYKDIFTTVTDINSPLLTTDIENVYYAMDKMGNVDFYLLEEGNLTPLKETGKFKISAKMSGQSVPAVIHYLEYDGQTTGFGLFTNEIYDDVYIYDYVFFKLSDFFPAYGVSSSTYLLMGDVDKTRFYSEDKVYSEIFKLYSDNSLEYFLNESQRTVDLNAKMRTDFKMFTNDIDDQEYSKLFFFSSRFYTAYDEYTAIDILSSGGSGENVDNIRYVTDVLSLNLWRTDDGIYYFKEAKSSDGAEETTGSNESFRLCFYDGSKQKTVKKFEGSLEDYLIDGDYILNCSSGEIYNVKTKKTFSINYDNMAKSFTPDMFTITEDGRYCVVRGANNRNNPAVIICDFKEEKQVDYTDDIFGFASNIAVSTDGSVAITVATDTSAASYYQIVASGLGYSYSTVSTTTENTDES